jgi:hypothetical protein
MTFSNQMRERDDDSHSVGPAQVGLALLVILTAACSGDDPPLVDGGAGGRALTIVQPGSDVGLSRGGQQTLQVRYSDTGGGIVGAPVHFAIFGDPRGSTLSADTAATDNAGSASIQVRAGAVSTRFQVRTSAAGAQDVTFYIEVSDAGFGSLLVDSAYLPGAVGVDQLKKLTYSLYGNIACASINPRSPPPALRSRLTSSVTSKISFKALPLNIDHTVAVSAQIHDSKAPGNGWVLQASGCAEVPASVLRDGHELLLTLPLKDLPLQLGGTYDLSTTVTLPQANRPLADALAPFSGLVDCPLDPAQLLLDCILDAIDGGDPLDCVVAAPSGKTQAMLAERGPLTKGCRGATTALKAPSLEQQLVSAADPAALAKIVTAVGQVEAKAATVLTRLSIGSTLKIFPAEGPGDIVVSHELVSVAISDGKTRVDLKYANLGVPVWLASPVAGSVDNKGALTLAQHGFTARYGLVARQALGQLVLKPLGLESDSVKQAAVLVHLISATGSSGKVYGCPAVDAIVCKAARLAPGCLGQACAEGIKAAGQWLDAGFTQIDGQHTDLHLSGEALLSDTNGDLTVDEIGTPSSPGTWTATLTMGAEVVGAKEATFVGKRK